MEKILKAKFAREYISNSEDFIAKFGVKAFVENLQMDGVVADYKGVKLKGSEKLQLKNKKIRIGVIHFYRNAVTLKDIYADFSKEFKTV